MTSKRYCTCAGTAPGYPQHEPFCMILTGIDIDLVEEDPEDTEWWLYLMTHVPEEEGRHESS